MSKIAAFFLGKNNLALTFGLLIAVLYAYRPAWNGQPVWDDDAHMAKPELRSAAGLMRIWIQPGAIPQYYPLTHTVFWAEHRLFGDATPGYHVFNILLHFFSALLLVMILRRLGVPGAWIAGGIFAFHPVMVESVAWITELKNTLSGVFFLGAGLAYLTFYCKREKRYYAIALILFLFGLFAKSVIVTLPAALLVVFWWKRGRLGWKRDVAPLLPFFAIGIISGLFTAWVERRFVGAVGSEFSFTVVDRCLIAGRAVWFYLYKLLWPSDLIFIYPRWHIDSTAAWQYLFPVAFLLVAALFWRLRKRSRAPLAVLLYFSVTLFPALGFFNLYFFRYSFVADHFQYLASLGPIAAVAASIDQGTGQLKEGVRRLARPLVCGMLLSILFLLTWNQSGMYSNAETLYRTTIRSNPGCWMAYYNLGFLLANRGRADEAEALYRKALEINPNHDRAHINLGILLTKNGRTGEALAHYQKAFEINPNSDEAHYNLGFLLAKIGRTDEALTQYLIALKINPGSAEAHYNLGNLLADMGRADDAMAHYLKALEINPNDHEIHNNFGILLANRGRTYEAIYHFQKALEINPNLADAYNNLGIQLVKTGRTDDAVAHYQKALEINPNYAEAHHNLGVLLANRGLTDEAITHFRKALEINPDEISTLKNIAFTLAQKGEWADATSILQNALSSAESAGDEPRAKMIAQLYETINSSQANSRTRSQR
jgi:tetratricopeptide (TPR) repeat protein